MAFDSLNLDGEGFINIKDLQDVLLSYMTTNRQSVSSSLGELRKLIPGIETLSPRSRSESVIQYIIKELGVKNLKAISVFKMADSTNGGQVQAAALENAFKKVLPSLRGEIVQEAMYAFKVSSAKDLIKRTDFELIFHEDNSK
jgi:hypothetical protein